MNPRKLLNLSLITLLVVSLALITSGCTSQKENTSNNGNSNITIRVANFPNIAHSQALIGRAEGQFQKAFGDTNKIEWKTFNAGPSEIEAIFAGEVDIGYIGPGPAINGYTKSKGELQIIAGATAAGAILVTRKGLILKSVNDLAGKKVAVPQFGNTQDLSLRNLLQENGLKDTTKGGTVEIRQVGNPDIKSLLDKGDIDAALVPEPWGSRLVKEINANVALDFNQIWREGKYSTAVVIVRTEFLKQHPDLVEKFLRVHVELTDFIHKNPDKAQETVNAQIKELTKSAIEKDVLDASFKRLTVTYDPEKESVLEFVKLSVDAKFLKVAPDTRTLFNLDILNKILKDKGKEEIK